MEELTERLKSSGFFFKKKLGQNFLTDPNLLDAIARDAGVTKQTAVLEIGAGAGALTRALSKAAGKVLSYEIDRTLQPVLSETLSGCENVEIVFRDFMKEDLSAVEKELGCYVVVANLPYYVTTPVLLRFVEKAKCCTGFSVMVQAEVADRMCAEAGGKDYGALTCAIARRGRCRIVRDVPRTLFTPRPNVDSAVVRCDFGEGGFEVKDERMYRAVVRCAFLSRRKTLENNLMGAFRLERPRAREILSACGIGEGVRGETLPPARLAALADYLADCGFCPASF